MGKTLRVAVIGKFYEDSFAMCVAQGFEKLGHEVRRVEDQAFFSTRPFPRFRMAWTLAFDRVPRLRRLVAKRIARLVTVWRPDLVVSVSKTLHPVAISEIKKAVDAPVVCWFPDAVSNLGRQVFLSSPFDLFCFKDRFLANVIKTRLGLPTAFLPDAAPMLGPITPLPLPTCDLLIACNLYPFRLIQMERLQEFRWEIYGNVPGWLTSPILRYHKRQYLSGIRKIEAYRRAAIVFNSNHFAEVEGINARTFEVCAAGAFLLTDHHPCLKEYYEPDVEVGVYEGIDDLRDRVRFYLRHPERRQQMARLAQERTLREHLHEHRVRRLIELAGVKV